MHISLSGKLISNLSELKFQLQTKQIPFFLIPSFCSINFFCKSMYIYKKKENKIKSFFFLLQSYRLIVEEIQSLFLRVITIINNNSIHRIHPPFESISKCTNLPQSEHDRNTLSIALSPAYFVGEATFARHRDKYIKTGGEFVSDDDSVGSRPPCTPVITFLFLPSFAAREEKARRPIGR